eukprot:403335396
MFKVSQTNVNQQKWTLFNVTTPSYTKQLYTRISEVDPNIRYHYIQCWRYNLSRYAGSVILLSEGNGNNIENSSFQIEQQWVLTSYGSIVCAGIYGNEQLISVAYFGKSTQDYAIIITFNKTDSGAFSKEGQIFYSSQNGFMIVFFSFIFHDIGKGVLAGTIESQSTGGQILYADKQGLSIDLPTPYYFSMGAYYQTQMYTVPLPEVAVINQVIQVVQN